MRWQTTMVLKGAALFVLAAAVSSTVPGCIGVNPDVANAAQSCQEFVAGGTVDEHLNVDASVRVFMQAAADFAALSTSVRGSLKTSCAGIATDLGASDSWTELGDSDDAISNGNGTGACDVAQTRITAVMQAHADANFALGVTRGACHPDFQAQE